MTSQVKVGQKVRATVEGRVVQVYERTYGRLVEVAVDLGDGDDLVVVTVPVASVEVLPEPLKVGDEIWWGSQTEPPDDSILRSSFGAVATRSGNAWYIAGHQSEYRWSDDEANGIGALAWRVVWLPGNPS